VRGLSGGYRTALFFCIALDLVAAATVLRPPRMRL
jgi:hypothetical protein